MLFFAAGQFDRVEQHAAQGLSRWQAHLLAIFLCRRLSARRWACAKIRQTMPCLRPPGSRTALRPALRSPGSRTAPALRPPGSRPPCALPHPRHLQKTDAVTQTPGARHGNHVPYPASRDIPGRCLACNHLLPPLFMQTCTHPFIKQLPLYALRQDVARADLFGSPRHVPVLESPQGRTSIHKHGPYK